MRPKNLICLFLSLIFTCLYSSAQHLQKFSVASFGQDPLDLTARNDQYKRLDDNGTLFSIIKVKSNAPDDDLQSYHFDFGLMNSFEVPHPESEELWVYVQKNAKTVTISREGYVSVSKYDLRTTIDAGCTYTMQLSVTSPKVYMQMLMFRVMPATAKAVVMVKAERDDAIEEMFGIVDETGAVAKGMPFGSYTYRVTAENFHPSEGRFTLNNQQENHIEDVTLRSNFGTITLTLDSDADIYVDGTQKGTRSWTGQLKAGVHQVECRQTNHRQSSQTITVAENETRTIKLTPPTPITGTLSITSRPLGANIRIDGKDYGQTPKMITDLLIGKHTVELSASNSKGAKQDFEIQENQATSLDMELDKLENAAVAAGENLEFTVTGNGKTVTFKMIRVEGGTFTMGASSEQGSDANDDEKPAHHVTLTSFYIGETEVTQALWQAVMGSNPSYFKGDNRPVEKVSWEDCQMFISELNSLTGKSFRLPTEAEWEYAARGGNKSRGYKYSGSNKLRKVGWYDDNSTHPVKTKSPNELGLYDMSGNVWEWCQDWKGSYSSSSQTDPMGASSGSARVRRGGCYGTNARFCRVSIRGNLAPDDRGYYLGLRLVL